MAAVQKTANGQGGQKVVATNAIRPASALVFSDKKEKKKRQMVQAGDKKIHRIILNSVSYAKYVWATSPSCIWFRLPNQDPGYCDLRERYRMNPFEGEMARYCYCMAPRFESDMDAHEMLVYSRARILSVQRDDETDTMYCYVLFIDHGFGQWVDGRSLGAVPYDLTSIPWQTIPVALGGVRPLRTFESTKSGWSSFHIKAIRDIMQEFDQFELSPFVHRGVRLTYDEYSRVRLVGTKENVKKNDDDQEADEDDEASSQFDITRLFFQRCMKEDPVQLSLEISELTEQSLYDTLVDEEIPDLDVRTIPPEFKDFPRPSAREGPDGIPCVTPPDNGELSIPEFAPSPINRDILSPEFKEPGDDDVDDPAEDPISKWDPDMNAAFYTEQVIERNAQNIAFFVKEDGKWTTIAIDSASRESPFKFYGYPMPFVKGKSSALAYNELTKKFYLELSEWQDQLNAFYFLTENCFVLSFDYLKTVQSAGQDVYAIYCDIDESDNHNFTRVKLLECCPERHGLHEHCLIVFLDRPGTRVVPSGTLLRLHSKFAKRPQLCIEMRLNDLIPPNGTEWDPQQIDQFRECCIADAPMRCQIARLSQRAPRELATFSVFNLTPAWLKVKYSVENLLVNGRMANLTQSES
ncbi:unnamed protein product [Bursaphelenchus xylophilus]|uniref:(pine wood nematode) hypothetical protein n=1 Tax=Bursaphelenchus xylophilus TaxID=6326 RepID=A0A1I7SSK9_BURXY|nr:unnamed protein product [Bursaphelenchus xylophilus]CAG9097444.1 unnamed protein product [Bursaphelenchus xylophilus]